MAKIDVEYNKLCRKVLGFGVEYDNIRRGAKRLQIPSYTFRYSFEHGFPAITNKELNFKNVVGELLWFLSGNDNIEYLNNNGIKIWNQDAWNWHKKNNGTLNWDQFNAFGRGSVGRSYGPQWRKFWGQTGYVDQIKNLLQNMRSDIMGSRLKVTAWNPSELDQTALPPCHDGFQIVGVPLGHDAFGFELHWNQRSTDVFLGLPYDIASYALLAKILEYLTGYKALAIEGTLKCVHFYDNQYASAKLLCQRDEYKHGRCEVLIHTPQLSWPPALDVFLEQLDINDFELVGYTSDPAINVKMLAPLNL